MSFINNFINGNFNEFINLTIMLRIRHKKLNANKHSAYSKNFLLNKNLRSSLQQIAIKLLFNFWQKLSV